MRGHSHDAKGGGASTTRRREGGEHPRHDDATLYLSSSLSINDATTRRGKHPRREGATSSFPFSLGIDNTAGGQVSFLL